MAITNTAASVDNYFKGTGIVSIRLLGETTYRDMGNVPVLEFTPNIETSEHRSSRDGARSVDKTFITSKGGTLNMVLEEFTAANIALLILGTPGAEVSGMIPIEVFAANSIVGSVRLVGTNDQGAKICLDLLRVEFTPTNTLPLISNSDDLDQMTLEGTVTIVDGVGFGTLYWNIGASTPAEPATIAA